MVLGSVKDIVFSAQHAGLGNPAIIVIGEVVRLHPSLLPAQVNEQIVLSSRS
ncbi:hypothetical protein [Paraflavitalea speifideaquila]|uniref:hypothetical protein n=1 Tax=Paraflavitalea speifideaquila TaxID=3076558 RepID=UPI0028EC4D48|nr:hypothetical protein [Paraflavitalea speifideiaquila]